MATKLLGVRRGTVAITRGGNSRSTYCCLCSALLSSVPLKLHPVKLRAAGDGLVPVKERPCFTSIKDKTTA